MSRHATTTISLLACLLAPRAQAEAAPPAATPTAPLPLEMRDAAKPKVETAPPSPDPCELETLKLRNRIEDQERDGGLLVLFAIPAGAAVGAASGFVGALGDIYVFDFRRPILTYGLGFGFGIGTTVAMMTLGSLQLRRANKARQQLKWGGSFDDRGARFGVSGRF